MTGLLADRVVVVSGVGPGLGKAICRRMADAGLSPMSSSLRPSRSHTALRRRSFQLCNTSPTWDWAI